MEQNHLTQQRAGDQPDQVGRTQQLTGVELHALWSGNEALNGNPEGCGMVIFRLNDRLEILR
jgi:hypothetical protein